jgi:DNA-binding protein YbaB
VSADLERLAAEFERFQAKIKQAEVKFAGVGEMQDRITRLEAVATSPDRSVRVVAGAGGAVMDLQLTPEALRQPAPALAATIMSTLREAVAEAVRRQAGIVDETVGDAFGVNTSDQVREAQAEALKTAVDGLAPEPTEPPAPSRRPIGPDDDDDFSQRTVYDHRR